MFMRLTVFAYCSPVSDSRFGFTFVNQCPDLERSAGAQHFYWAPEGLRRAREDPEASDLRGAIDKAQQKGPLNDQRPFVTLNFRSYDNPNTICQNLPEAAETSAGAEEGQRE